MKILDKKYSSEKEKVSSLKLLWNFLPLNIKRFAVVVFIVLICSSFFAIFFAGDAVSELRSISRQIDNYTK